MPTLIFPTSGTIIGDRINCYKVHVQRIREERRKEKGRLRNRGNHLFFFASLYQINCFSKVAKIFCKALRSSLSFSRFRVSLSLSGYLADDFLLFIINCLLAENSVWKHLQEAIFNDKGVNVSHKRHQADLS
jgi:hypothetical protein